jgi:N-acetylglucosamine-6-phosphate deacetylase
MTEHTTLHGRILTPSGWVDGTMTLQQGRIAHIEARALPAGASKRLLLPGFIDLHVHGGGGSDIMEAGTAALKVARAHARFGTTSMLATTMTAPTAEIEAVLADIGRCCHERAPGSARLLGVHLEGPYINPGKLGAQPNQACRAALDEIERLRALAPIRLITLAPEVAGHMPVIRALSEAGVRVQIGHTLGSYEDGVEAIANGASGFTHLFNAMTGLHHREPGMVGAALAHANYAELIPDLLHVHPGAIRTALRAIPHLYCVTDSTAAAGMPDGEYKLGSHAVFKCMGGVRLGDGTLAGSTLTMDQALRNLVSIGLPLEDASHRLSRYPADYLGLDDRGRLAEGAWADVVVMDEDLNLIDVYLEGERNVLADA